ncbi:MAG: NAD(P)/FAD-dependent oxidoreductase [Candidatus Yanofskybacteria bacterium]|nr:NAD(P)/FAD-dependent oxidoreductase [Candidatus Yanofskybacteria bacterium]
MVNILIIGGGFGGVRTALDLNKKLSSEEASITLVDRNNYHLFLPSLYEVASSFGLDLNKEEIRLKKTIAIPFGEIFEDTKVNFVQAEIVSVDLNKKEVRSKGEKFFRYDYLVLALGAETETFGTAGVVEYAYKFKSVEEAVFLNKKINEKYKEAERGQRPLPVRFIVVGAGFNGIELAGELACCTKKIAEVCKLKNKCTEIKLVEAAPQILPMVYDKERAMIRKRLERLGVEVLENSPIEQVGPDFVQIKNGPRLNADFIIWTAGIRASSFLKNISGLKLDERGKMTVNEFMQSSDRPEVFGVGDSAVFLDPATKKPVPALAYVAVDQGKVVAENILRVLKNKRPQEYRPFYNVWIAPVGGKFAVARLGKNFTVSGFWGWVLRELVDFRYMYSILPFSKAVSLMSENVAVFTKND